MTQRLIAQDLAVARGARLILRDLSFSLASGRALVITGRNGAGKTTLLRALAGLLPLASGYVKLLDEGSGREDEDLQARLHYIGHQDGLKGALTALENLEFWRNLLGANGGESPQSALERFGLGPIGRIACSYLSAGQKRRISLARLVTSARPLWLLDEPTNALDVPTQNVLGALMKNHLSRGGMILAATHARLPIQADQLQLFAGESAVAP